MNPFARAWAGFRRLPLWGQILGWLGAAFFALVIFPVIMLAALLNSPEDTTVTLAPEPSEEAAPSEAPTTEPSETPAAEPESEAPTAATESEAPEGVEVPDVTGMIYGEALTALEKVGLLALPDLVETRAHPEGEVYRQEPAAGSVAEVDDRVKVTVAASPPAPDPNPDGTFSSSCDYLLGDFGDGDYRFVASAKMKNTGNIGIVVKAVAKWEQIGGGPIKDDTEVRVKTRSSRTVHFDVPATSDQIDRHQSLNGFNNCSVKLTIVDTFGKVR